MWHHRRNPITWITRAYYQLLEVVPTYRDALNICLVLGELRSATFVASDRDAISEEIIRPNYTAIHRILMNICKGKKKIGITGVLDMKGHKCPLIFSPRIGDLVGEWGGDLNNHKLFGEVLGYYCEGDINLNDTFFFNLITINPETENVNPFFSQACAEISEDTMGHFTQFGQEVKDFFMSHEITDKVGFDIQDKKGKEVYSIWF